MVPCGQLLGHCRWDIQGNCDPWPFSLLFLSSEVSHLPQLPFHLPYDTLNSVPHLWMCLTVGWNLRDVVDINICSCSDLRHLATVTES